MWLVWYLIIVMIVPCSPLNSFSKTSTHVFTQPKSVMKNDVIFAEVNYDRLQNDCHRWLEDEAVLLTEKYIKSTKQQYNLC